jgi:hypothetical protein
LPFGQIAVWESYELVGQTGHAQVAIDLGNEWTYVGESPGRNVADQLDHVRSPQLFLTDAWLPRKKFAVGMTESSRRLNSQFLDSREQPGGSLRGLNQLANFYASPLIPSVISVRTHPSWSKR